MRIENFQIVKMPNLLLPVLLLVAASSLFVSVTCNRASPPEKVIKLALAASKASYMPFLLQGNLFPFGFIKENAGTIPALPTLLVGTLADLMPKPNVFSILPPQIYNVFLDKGTCKIGLWDAAVHISKDSQVIRLRNRIKKVIVFGFRGTEAYSLKDLEEDFLAQLVRINMGGKIFSVHKPFSERYNNTAEWFEAEYSNVPKDYAVILTGYDVGGSQAFAAALIATLKTGRLPDAVVAFGAPPVGDLEFQHQYRTVVGCDRTVSIAVIQDIFTRLPVGVIRPCADKPVDGGNRHKDVILEGPKDLFLKNFPIVVPQIVNGLLPPDLKKIVNSTFPVEKQQEALGELVGTVDKAFDIMLDFDHSHNLYNGYTHGIDEAYEEQTIDYGCNRDL